MVRRLAIGMAALALACAAGCGDDDEDAGSAEGTPGAPAQTQAPEPTSTTESPGSGAGAEPITIRMKDFAYDPEEVGVQVGQEVTWVNEDDAPHNATEEGGALATETVGKDGEVSFTPEEAGTIDYLCTVHPNMTGTLTVTE